MKHLHLLLAAVCAFALCDGCTRHATGRLSVSAQTQARLSDLGDKTLTIAEGAITGAGTAAANSAGSQYLNGGKVDSSQIEAAAIAGAINGAFGAAAGVRTLEGAKQTPTAAQIQTAIATSTGPTSAGPALAAPVSKAVANAIAAGAPPDAALETAARSLERSAQLAGDTNP